MSPKLPTAPRSRRSAQALFLREKSLRSRNPSLVSVSAAIAADSRKASEYAKQLREKQKVRRMYGVNEGQFKRYYQIASSAKGNTAERMLQLLESRLDNVIYRLGLARTRAEARQLTTHGWFSVNDRKVDIPSLLVKPGDRTSLSHGKNPHFFQDRELSANLSWLDLDKKNLKALVTGLATRAEIDPDINEQLIVEYYSR